MGRRGVAEMGAFEEVRFARRDSREAGAKFAVGSSRKVGPTLYRGCMDEGGEGREEVRVGAEAVAGGPRKGSKRVVVVRTEVEVKRNEEVGEVRQLHRLLEGGRGKGQWGEVRGVSGLKRRLLLAAPGLGKVDPFEDEVKGRVFGPATERLVKKFQKSQGMVGDGIVGPETWALLATEQREARAREMRRRDQARDAGDSLDVGVRSRGTDRRSGPLNRGWAKWPRLGLLKPRQQRPKQEQGAPPPAPPPRRVNDILARMWAARPGAPEATSAVAEQSNK